MDPCLPTTKVSRNYETTIDKTLLVEPEKVTGSDGKVDEDNSMGHVRKPVIKSIP